MSARTKMLLFAAGIACGAAAGVLLAPDKGSKTRKSISGKGKKISDSVTGFYDSAVKRFVHESDDHVKNSKNSTTQKA